MMRRAIESCSCLPTILAVRPWLSNIDRALVIVCLIIPAIVLPAQATENIGTYEFSVRALHPAELPADTSQEWMQFFGPGLASGALGAVAPPMFASSLIVGGLLLVPSALIISGQERKIWERATKALNNVTFEADLMRAVSRRAAAILPKRAGTTAQVELIVNGYGLAGARPGHVCFIASADLIVRVADQVMLRDSMRITESNPNAASASTDTPPAQCASLERFAAQDGQLVRDTAVEYAEVLAAMAIDSILDARTK